jgi:hypothetical protein
LATHRPARHRHGSADTALARHGRHGTPGTARPARHDTARTGIARVPVRPPPLPRQLDHRQTNGAVQVSAGCRGTCEVLCGALQSDAQASRVGCVHREDPGANSGEDNQMAMRQPASEDTGPPQFDAFYAANFQRLSL